MTDIKIAEKLNGKKILIWGFGREGRAVLDFINSHCSGCVVDVTDRRRIEESLPGTNRVYQYEENEIPPIMQYDLVLKSPGIPMDGIGEGLRSHVSSLTQIFLEAYRHQVIGVTGTKGKSTTSSMIAHILKESGKDAVLLGNIGLPCINYADQIGDDTIIVFELSCHQLENLTVSPHVAVYLNLYPDHLDHYHTFERYAMAKEHIYLGQEAGDALIIGDQVLRQGYGKNAQDTAARTIVACNENASGEDGVTLRPDAADIDVRKNVVVFRNAARIADENSTGSIVVRREDTKLRGLHNVYNIAVAYEICCEMYGVTKDQFFEALKNFDGLKHRLELVGRFDGADYYDDSISTVYETTIAAVRSIENASTLIIGGMDRGIDYAPLVDYLLGSGLSTVLLLPDTDGRIAGLFQSMKKENGRKVEEYQSYELQERTALPGVTRSQADDEHVIPTEPLRIVHCRDLKDAVRAASVVTLEGEACILSPAAASYGFFKNFEERGEKFAEFLKEIYR
ncbi:MAG: UDP-N-acetylmuramoyl-L-alanine--D-glutamate ligase [Lachnospiraceae bacterium]|nr:UDP-N-acetylmuramoyl-L-alanine--D-glutamate ligase [Lachnospiraceae bacterium]